MNVFRLAGDMTHLLSVVVLLLKIHTIKSCAGNALLLFSLSAPLESGGEERNHAGIFPGVRARVLERDRRSRSRGEQVVVAVAVCAMPRSACPARRSRSVTGVSFRCAAQGVWDLEAEAVLVRLGGGRG